jgi:hypothetical protein
VLQGTHEKAKTLLRLRKIDKPKFLELVDKANILGVVKYGNSPLVIYDGEGFAVGVYVVLTLSRIWVFHRRTWQAHRFTVLHFLGLQGHNICDSWLPSLVILTRVH